MVRSEMEQGRRVLMARQRNGFHTELGSHQRAWNRIEESWDLTASYKVHPTAGGSWAVEGT